VNMDVCSVLRTGCAHMFRGAGARDEFVAHVCKLWPFGDPAPIDAGVVTRQCTAAGCRGTLRTFVVADVPAGVRWCAEHNAHSNVSCLEVNSKRDRACVAATMQMAEAAGASSDSGVLCGIRRLPHAVDKAVVGIDIEHGDVTELLLSCARNPPLREWQVEFHRREAAMKLLVRHGAAVSPNVLVFAVGEDTLEQQQAAFGARQQHMTWDGELLEMLDALHDVTGRELVVMLNSASGSAMPAAIASAGAAASGSGISGARGVFAGREQCVAAVVLQCVDPAVICRLRELYELASLMRGMFSTVVRHQGDGQHVVSMAGNALILTDQKAIAPGYACQVLQRTTARLSPTAADKALRELCEEVWGWAVQRLPLLAKYRQEFLTELGQGMCLGACAASHVAMTDNASVELHLDGNDGPLSLILWLHGGSGQLRGGSFCMPGLGVRLVPLDCTMVVLCTSRVWHGTAPLAASSRGGSSHSSANSSSRPPIRVGSSHFIRVPDVTQLLYIEAAAGGRQAMEERQAQVLRDVAAAKQKLAEYSRWEEEHAAWAVGAGGSKRCRGSGGQNRVAASALPPPAPHTPPALKAVLQEIKAQRDAMLQMGKAQGVEGFRLDTVRRGFFGWLPADVSKRGARKAAKRAAREGAAPAEGE
ncbi:hypothetical protein Agub_g12712, partial [Astrephomene gubernaculifera]